MSKKYHVWNLCNSCYVILALMIVIGIVLGSLIGFSMGRAIEPQTQIVTDVTLFAIPEKSSLTINVDDVISRVYTEDTYDANQLCIEVTENQASFGWLSYNYVLPDKLHCRDQDVWKEYDYEVVGGEV